MTGYVQEQKINDEYPLVTFALFSYNQEKYIREAVTGALSQTYSPLEIILSDDYSNDRTFNIIQKMTNEYSGQHTIKVIRNDKNMGVCAHVDAVAKISTGRLLVIAAGDDISECNRVEEIVKCWRQQKPSAIYSNAIQIDENGHEIGKWKVFSINRNKSVRKIKSKNDFLVPHFYGAGAAYDRNLFMQYGSLPNDVRNEDYILAWRALMSNGISYVYKNLLRYRKHNNNLSFWVMLSNSSSSRETITLKKQQISNEIKNLQYVLSHATEQYGEDSKVVKKIKNIIANRYRRHSHPYLYLYVDKIKQFLRQLYNAI